MSVLHASYGLGAFAAPLVSTQFAQMKRWSFHFLISMGVAFISLVLNVYVFRLKRQEGKPRPSSVQVEQVTQMRCAPQTSFLSSRHLKSQKSPSKRRTSKSLLRKSSSRWPSSFWFMLALKSRLGAYRTLLDRILTVLRASLICP